MSIGVEVRTRTAPPSRGAPTDTDTLFVVGKATTGPLDVPTVIRSILDFEGVYGARVTGNARLYDTLDVFFRESGTRAVVGRYTDALGSTVSAGLGLFDLGLGPGQVAAPDETPGAATYTALLDHAINFNRFALLDVANGDTIAAMTTLGGAIPQGTAAYGAAFGPWTSAPAPAGVIGGASRQVPASATVAGMIARADRLGNPNRAAAGRDFPFQYGTGFVRPVSDADRAALLNVGVNTFVEKQGLLQLYGFQTALAQSSDTPFWQANCGRARMWLKARALAAGEHYMFKTIDGRGLLANALKTDLDAVCLELYSVDGLFGVTPEEAFATQVGASVNTIATIAQGELNAVVEARLSLHAKRVLIDLVSIPVSGTITS